MKDDKDSAEDRVKEQGWKAVEALIKKGEKGTLLDPFKVKIYRERIKLVLNVEGNDNPLTKISIDGVHLGYINSQVDPNRINSDEAEIKGHKTVEHIRNAGVFNIECFRRGSGVWKKQTLLAEPTNGEENYYKKAKFINKFQSQEGNEEDNLMEIQIEIRKKKNFWFFGNKKKPFNI